MHNTTEKHLRLNSAGALIDFDKDAFATLEIQCCLTQAVDLTICIGEKLSSPHRIDSNPGGHRIFQSFTKHCEKGCTSFMFPIKDFQNPYRVSPTDPNIIDPRLPEGAETEVAPFRYVELSPCSGDITLRRKEFFCDFDDNASDFKCSNHSLNRIWDFCKYSIKATACFGVYIDGNRERKPYEGDAFINQLTHFCCDRNYDIAKNTIDFLFEHPTWPKEWRLIMPAVIRDYVLYSGDTEAIARWRNDLEKSLLCEYENNYGLLNDCIAGCSETGLLKDIVDWPQTERDGYVFGEINTVPNSYYYGALNTAYQLTGEKHFADKAKKVKDAMVRLLYKQDMFADSLNSDHTALHSVFFPLYFNVAHITDAMKKAILSKGMDCSVYGSQFLLEACFRNGLAQHGFELMTGNGLRSWLNMLEKGATVTMEAWDDTLKPNQDWNHAWATSAANIMMRFIAGIRPVEPGFTKFTVDPNFCGLEWLSVKQPTPKGEICLTKESDKTIRLTVPENTTAIYCGREYRTGIHNLSI